MPGEHPAVYTIPEVAEVSRVCVGTVFNELKTGRLKATKLGRRTLITRAQLEDWFKRLPAR
jgi:excisionase family DNA binding protein